MLKNLQDGDGRSAFGAGLSCKLAHQGETSLWESPLWPQCKVGQKTTNANELLVIYKVLHAYIALYKWTSWSSWRF